MGVPFLCMFTLGEFILPSLKCFFYWGYSSDMMDKLGIFFMN